MERKFILPVLLVSAAILVVFMTPREITVTRSQGLILATSTVNEAAAIDSFFAKRNMPLAGYGQEMVDAAQRNKIDWRLLPAISVRESSGGLQSCGANPFGWASCQSTFSTIDDAINTVARSLGGNATSTRSYYAGKTTAEILTAYNPPAIAPNYVSQVEAIMAQIGPEQPIAP